MWKQSDSIKGVASSDVINITSMVLGIKDRTKAGTYQPEVRRSKNSERRLSSTDKEIQKRKDDDIQQVLLHDPKYSYENKLKQKAELYEKLQKGEIQDPSQLSLVDYSRKRASDSDYEMANHSQKATLSAIVRDMRNQSDSSSHSDPLFQEEESSRDHKEKTRPFEERQIQSSELSIPKPFEDVFKPIVPEKRESSFDANAEIEEYLHKRKEMRENIERIAEETRQEREIEKVNEERKSEAERRKELLFAKFLNKDKGG
ncbi:hypothetical protein BLNAU_11887 [Blattamonas nauphoetae]|uniref:Uncharacterized protein n=1 Tax=Blattamonas nauphoetae TaxID=2049346 RepID=A0ABQ9XNZ7_9EUKA|nr:hypothetical protein BLNAU_11887 [Blattamonas nauphoetae]